MPAFLASFSVRCLHLEFCSLELSHHQFSDLNALLSYVPTHCCVWSSKFSVKLLYWKRASACASNLLRFLFYFHSLIIKLQFLLIYRLGSVIHLIFSWVAISIVLALVRFVSTSIHYASFFSQNKRLIE